MASVKRRPPLRIGGTRWLAGLALVGLAACYESHEPETGIPVTVLTAELNILQLPVAEPEPAVGALVRAERCVDGAVVEAKVKADGRAWIDFGDDLEFDCWTVTAVLQGTRPTAVTLVRAEAPLLSAILLDQRYLATLRPPGEGVTLEWTVTGAAFPESGVSIHGAHIDTDVRLRPAEGDRFSIVVERRDALDEGALFAIEWVNGIPVNTTTFTIDPFDGDVAEAVIAFPSPAAPIHHVRLPFQLPETGLFPFGPFIFEDSWFWGTGGWVWGVRNDGRTTRVGNLIFEYDEASDPPWTVEAVWPDLPWTETILAHEPWMGFAFARSASSEGDPTYGFVDGPIEEGSHLVIPPIERASIEGPLPGEIAVDVGGEGHVGFLWLQGGDDPFIEHSRYRIYSAPNEPLTLDAWPTLPGGMTIEDLDLAGADVARATIGVADPHGNPGWMHRPVSEQRGRRLFVGFLEESAPGSF